MDVLKELMVQKSELTREEVNQLIMRKTIGIISSFQSLQSLVNVIFRRSKTVSPSHSRGVGDQSIGSREEAEEGDLPTDLSAA